jgi:hypothetical protein
MKRNTIVNRNASPHPIAANLMRVLSISILLEYSCDRLSNSEVMRSIIDVEDSHKLRSVSVRGMLIQITTPIVNRPRLKHTYLPQLYLENFSNIIYTSF